jgi:hypothetical protein
MEEKKLSIEVQKKDLSSYVQRIEDNTNTRLPFEHNASKFLGESINDNWYELRFSNVGPDRRGYHSSFIHNKR